MVNNVAGALKEQMGAAAAASQETYDAAERIVRSTRRCAALGDGMSMHAHKSQMSSSQTNGGRRGHHDRVDRSGEQREAGAGAGHGDGRWGPGAQVGHQRDADTGEVVKVDVNGGAARGCA